MKRLLLLCALLLACSLFMGCAPLSPTRELRVQWLELEPPALTQQCYPGKYPPGGVAPGLHGCFEFRFGGGCTIYTLPESARPTERDYHETVGHELRHCRDGYFHDEELHLPGPVKKPRYPGLPR